MTVSTAASGLSFGARAGQIVRRRQLLVRLVAGDLKRKYESSTLGYLWSIVEPLMLTGVYFFVFSVIVRLGRNLYPYPLFLVSGILPWLWVTSAIGGSTRALTNNARVITTIYAPRELFPLSVVATKTFEFVLSLPVLVVFAAIYRIGPSGYLAALPLAMLLQITLLTGTSLIVSAANTLLRDIERVLRPLLRALFYLSPVLYPLARVTGSDIPGVFKALYRLNPLVGILELYRAVWYPELFRGWSTVAISAAGSAAILAVGWTLFTRLERPVLKEL